jgi:tetratricopeptide (TPR) repeat protein
LRILITTLILLSALACPVAAETPTQLLRIDKAEETTSTRLSLDFSALPEHRLEVSGQRVDLFLSDTEAVSLPAPPEDGKVLKVLLARQGRLLMVSFLLRTAPASVKVLTDPGNRRLLLHLDWGSGRAPARLAISRNPPRLASLKGGQVVKNILEGEDFSASWRRFCEEYETPLRIDVPVRYSLPPLPLLVFSPATTGAVGARLAEGVEALSGGRWTRALELFDGVPPRELTGVDREAHALLHGETLLRLGETGRAQTVLDNFLSAFPESALRSRALYLLGYLRALRGEPYDSGFLLGSLRETARDAAYYRQLGLLLRAEVELATERPKAALATLDQEPLAAQLSPYGGRTRADALFDLGDTAAALEQYRALNPQVKAWGAFPQSLARLAEACYRQKDFAAAVARYAELAQVAGTPAARNLAAFGHARALIRSGRADAGMSQLRTLAAAPQEDEAAQRARLLILDQEVLAAPAEKGFMKVLSYQQLGVTAVRRELREEAAFKHVLLAALQNIDRTTLGFLEEFIRQHRQGRFQDFSQALLNELLPRVIRQTVRRQDYFGALVLVEKYRDHLAALGTGSELLLDLGGALRRLGLLDKTADVYFYMLDAYRGDAGEEPFYAPLLEVLAAKEDHRLVIEYADRYLERFPKGAQVQPVLTHKLRALTARKDYPEAVKILTSTELKRTPELDLLAGTVFWEVADMDRTAESLARALTDPALRAEHPQQLLRWAEAEFKRKRFDAALPLYRELEGVAGLADQARYRQGQILLALGRRGEALKLFTDLAEKGEAPQWRQAASGALFAETPR